MGTSRLLVHRHLEKNGDDRAPALTQSRGAIGSSSFILQLCGTSEK